MRGAGRWLLWWTAAIAIAFSQLQLLDSPSLDPDARKYIAMAQGRDTNPPFRYRVVVPGLARMIPDRVLAAVTRRPNPTPAWFAALKLCVLNAFWLAGCGYAVWSLCLALGFRESSALLGSLIFYMTRPVVQFGASPMIDPANWLTLALGATFLLRREWGRLAVVFLVGVLVKETILLLVPLAFLLPERPTWRNWLVFLPGLAALVLMRVVTGVDVAAWVHPSRLDRIPKTVALWTSVGGLRGLFVSSFGLLWLLAGYGFTRKECPAILRRWCWIFLPMLALMFWLSTDLGRLLFLSFPVVLPLALVGLDGLATTAADPRA